MRPSKLRLPRQHARDDQVARRRSPRRPAPAAARGCRCRSCSRSRRVWKPQLLEVRRQPGLGQVVGDDLRARGEATSSPTACVCRPRSTAFFASSPAATITDGFDVFVQLVIAAITTEPCCSVGRRRRRRGRVADAGVAVGSAGLPAFFFGFVRLGSASRERLLHVWTARRGPAGASGPARLGSTVAEVELAACRCTSASGVVGAVEQALLLRVRLDQLDLLVGRPVKRR